jgi:hypothetical protein
LVVDVAPDGVVEMVGDHMGFLDRRVGGHLDRFKRFIEGRGSATGGWRGEIHGDDVWPGTDVDPEPPTARSLHHPEA